MKPGRLRCKVGAVKAMQRILVYAQDPVLAKKVRFLMERDECKVEVLPPEGDLDARLGEGCPTLLVLSRKMSDGDAVEHIDDLKGSLEVPPTLVLGGEPRPTPEAIHLIPDPVDTQAIYREATRLLQSSPIELSEPVPESSPEAGDEPNEAPPLDEVNEFEPAAGETTAADDGGPAPVPPSESQTEIETTIPAVAEAVLAEGDDESDEEVTSIEDEIIGVAEESPLDDIADELNALESGQLDEQLADAFALEDEPPAMEDATAAAPELPPAPVAADVPVDAGPLEPAGFARALHQVWANKEAGAIVVEKDGERTTIHFEDGRPVSVVSSIPGDALGRALVDRRRLTQGQYADAAMHAIERGCRLADAVVALDFLSDEDVGTELGTSAREELVACFAAPSGRFWIDDGIEVTGPDRPYRLEVGHIIAQGMRLHAAEPVIDEILEDRLSGYFKLKNPGYELQKSFPLSKSDLEFLAYEGRAYNVEDAADGAGLPLSEARKLIAILAVCDEVEPFSPGAQEFEARIREERQTRRSLESQVPKDTPPAAALPPTPPAPPAPPSPEPTTAPEFVRASEAIRPPPEPAPEAPAPPSPAASNSGGGPFGNLIANSAASPRNGEDDSNRPRPFPPSSQKSSEELPPLSRPSNGAALGAVSTPAAPPPRAPAPPPPPAQASTPSAPSTPPAEDIPPMPLPGAGEGVVPRPLAYAKPLPRAPDGSLVDTRERAISREHFQKGVSLLGQGNFSSAEEHFRDAVALCAEEHVYLIGLARAIYYNPSYRADGKVPILRSIVDRAKTLAPEDKRVSTLEAWVQHAEVAHS